MSEFGVEIEPESVTWISDSATLAAHCQHWDDVIGLDTEFIRTDTFYPLPGLYQVIWCNQVYLLDPISIEDFSAFVNVLENAEVCKVMHACQEDLELIHHHLGVNVANIFDTQLANAFVSVDFSLSYASLVEQVLGVSLDKHATRSNWLKRPLSDEQMRYAVEDVVYLPGLHNALVELLGERAHWFAGEMAPRADYQPPSSDQYYLNVKKAWQLSGPQLSILRSLCTWREDTAKSLNIPRNRVVWDDHLYHFARLQSLTSGDVRDALPRVVANKYAQGLMDAHRDGLGGAVPPGLPGPLTSQQNAMVKRLREAGRLKAADLGLAPELLSRKREVEACVRHYATQGTMSDLFLGWRSEALHEVFNEIFQSHSAT
ncbi:MAG: HRDC domain-containing protein [Pseudomonadota bacterium]